MILYSKVTSEPGEEPVTLDEVKSQVKMEGTSLDDTYLTNLIITARQLCEADSGLSFIEQERRINLDKFPSGIIIVPYGPVTSIDTFSYVDVDGVSQPLTEGTHFRVDLNSDLCRLQAIDSWPATKVQMNAVTIDYTAGYANAAAVPQVIKDAILRTAANLHTYRTDNVEGSYSAVDYTVRTLLDRVRVSWNAWQD